MTAPSEPGPWELYRAVEGVQATLLRIEERMVPRPEFDQFKLEIERRFKDGDDRLAVHASDKAATYGKIEGQVAELRKALDQDRLDRLTWMREVNARVWVGLGLGTLALVGGVVTRAMGL